MWYKVCGEILNGLPPRHQNGTNSFPSHHHQAGKVRGDQTGPEKETAFLNLFDTWKKINCKQELPFWIPWIRICLLPQIIKRALFESATVWLDWNFQRRAYLISSSLGDQVTWRDTPDRERECVREWETDPCYPEPTQGEGVDDNSSGSASRTKTA